jgi:hypothetical protein
LEAAESVLAATSLLPLPQDVRAAARTRTVKSFFIVVILVGRKGRLLLFINQDL